MRAVLLVGSSFAEEPAGSHQPVSCGMPVLSTPKWTSVKGRLSEAGVVATVREGWRTSCHCPCAKRRHMVV